MPKVSIIMPVFNGSKYLEKSIGSLLSQSFADFEIIAVNDGSTDDSLAVLERFAEQDGRLVVLSRPNSGGPAAPKNDGLRVARGQYLGFLDYDDYSHADHLQRLVEGLDAHPGWIAAFHDLEMVDADGRPLQRSYLEETDFRTHFSEYLVDLGAGWFECTPDYCAFMSTHRVGIHTQSVLIARQRIPHGDIFFNTKYRIADDIDLWYRLGRMGRIGYCDNSLGNYRTHEAGITRRKWDVAREILAVHADQYAVVSDTLDRPRLEKYRDKIAYLHGRLAYDLYVSGDHRSAREIFTRALRWRTTRGFYLGLLKTYFPPAFAAWLRRARGT